MAKVLVLNDGSRLYRSLRKIVAGVNGLTLVPSRSAAQALQKTERVRPSLVIVNLSTSSKELRTLIRDLREIVPSLPVFAFVEQYDIAQEREVLLWGATAIFSWKDEPAAILANIQEACSFDG